MAAGLEKGDRVGIWSPNYAEWTLVQYATAEIGVILVNINPAYRTHELAYALQHSGCRMLIAAPAFKTSDYRAMVDEVRADCPELETAVFFWDPAWDELAGGGSTTDAELDAAPGHVGGRRPDQHPVHVRNHRLPEGRDPLAPQHLEQRAPRRRAAGASRPPIGCASRCPSTTASAW